jgi:hypothetical protein
MALRFGCVAAACSLHPTPAGSPSLTLLGPPTNPRPPCSYVPLMVEQIQENLQRLASTDGGNFELRSEIRTVSFSSCWRWLVG